MGWHTNPHADSICIPHGHRFYTWLLHFKCGSLLIPWEMKGEMVHSLGAQHPCGISRLSPDPGYRLAELWLLNFSL